MKTRNQFLRQAVRLLCGTFTATLLGIGCGNFVKNNEPLLVKVDRALVSPVVYASTNQEVKKEIMPQPIIAVKSIILVSYTQKNAVANLPRFEPVMNICFYEGRRLGLISLSISNNLSKVTNNRIGKPPRSDMINDINTS